MMSSIHEALIERRNRHPRGVGQRRRRSEIKLLLDTTATVTANVSWGRWCVGLWVAILSGRSTTTVADAALSKATTTATTTHRIHPLPAWKAPSQSHNDDDGGDALVAHILRMPHGGGNGAASDNEHHHHQEGDNNINNSDLTDEDMDEYIDFLLAYAEDRAIEADNPLFKKDVAATTTVDPVEKGDENEEEEEERFEIIPSNGEAAVDDPSLLDAPIVPEVDLVTDAEIQAVDQPEETPVDDTEVAKDENDKALQMNIEEEIDEEESEDDLRNAVVESSLTNEESGVSSDTVDAVDDPEDSERDTEGPVGVEIELELVVSTVDDTTETLDVFTVDDTTEILDDADPAKQDQRELEVEEAMSEDSITADPEYGDPNEPIAESPNVTEKDQDEDFFETLEMLEEERAEHVMATQLAHIEDAATIKDEVYENLTEVLVVSSQGVAETEERVVDVSSQEMDIPEESVEMSPGDVDEEENDGDVSTQEKDIPVESEIHQSIPSLPAESNSALELLVDGKQDSVPNRTKSRFAFSKLYYHKSVAVIREFWKNPRKPIQDSNKDFKAPTTTRDYTKVYRKYFPTQHVTITVDNEEKKQVQRITDRLKNGFAKPWGTIVTFLERERTGWEEDVDEPPEMYTQQSSTVASTISNTATAVNESEDSPTFLRSLNTDFSEDQEDVSEADEVPLGRIEFEPLIEEEQSELGINVLTELRKERDAAPEDSDSSTNHVDSTPDTFEIEEIDAVVSQAVKEDQVTEKSHPVEVENIPESEADGVEEVGEEGTHLADQDVGAEESLLEVTEEEIIEIHPVQVEHEIDLLDNEYVQDDVDDEAMPHEEVENTFAELQPVEIEDIFDVEIDEDEDLTLQADVDHDDVNEIGEMDLDPTQDVASMTDMEPSNAIWRFMIRKGLETAVMVLILVFEWLRLYVMEPITESADMLVQAAMRHGMRGGSTLFFKLLKTRGGDIRAVESEDEDDEVETNDAQEVEVASREMKDDDSGESENADSVSSDSSDHPETPIAGDSADDTSKRFPADLDTSLPRVRPNRMYRFLLGYGYFGHMLILDCILLVEWLKVYVPFVPNLAAYVMYEVLRIQPPSMRGKGESAVLRTSGFLGADGTSVRAGKKKKSQTKKEDQKALEQLKRLGDVNQARYMFLSQTFMKRHALGPYSSRKSGKDDFHIDLDLIGEGVHDSLEEEMVESDSEWIMQALINEEEEEVMASPIETDVGLSFGSEGPRVSVGVGFSIGESRGKRSKKRSSSLSSIVRQSQVPAKTKKTAGPRVSDRESGVMGRLRAAGANSLMGRNLLGAYPGDLPPPQEAADANGLYDLAERYGYGEWSDNDDSDGFIDDNDGDDGDDDDDELGLAPEKSRKKSTKKTRKTKSSSTSKTAKKKRRNSTSSLGEVGLSFDFDDGDSRHTRPSSSSSSSPPQELQSLNVSRRSSKPLPKDVLPQSSPSSSGLSRSSSKRVRPAMSLLNEIKSKDDK